MVHSKVGSLTFVSLFCNIYSSLLRLCIVHVCNSIPSVLLHRFCFIDLHVHGVLFIQYITCSTECFFATICIKQTHKQNKNKKGCWDSGKTLPTYEIVMLALYMYLHRQTNLLGPRA